MIEMKEKRSIIKHPVVDSVEVGTRTIIPCFSPTIYVQWSFNGAFLPSNSKFSTNNLERFSTLILENVSSRESGIYRCITMTANKAYIYSEIVLTVHTGKFNLMRVYSLPSNLLSLKIVHCKIEECVAHQILSTPMVC